MRVDVNTEITGYDGVAIVTSINKDEETGTETKVIMTIGSMMISSLNQPQESDKDMTPEQKIRRAVMSQDIYNAMQEGSKQNFVDLPSEDITEIKALLNNFYTPLALMKAYEILDPKVADVSRKAK